MHNENLNVLVCQGRILREARIQENIYQKLEESLENWRFALRIT